MLTFSLDKTPAFSTISPSQHERDPKRSSCSAAHPVGDLVAKPHPENGKMKKLNAIGALLAAATASAALAGPTIYFVEDGSDTLRTINTDTLAVTTIGPLGTGGNFGDLAYDHSTNTMYYIGGRDDNALYTIHLGTGAATHVGDHGINDLFSLAADPAGNLYAQATDGNTYSISSANGSAALIGANGVYPGGSDWNGNLNRITFLEAGGGRVFTINTGDGSASEIANPGNINDNDIAWDAVTGDSWAMDWSGNIYRYDAAFNRTFFGSFDGITAAIEIIVIPTPASLSLLGLAGIAALRRRR